MASQQAWDDFNALTHYTASFHSEIGGTLKAQLDRMSDLFNAIVADADRLAEVTALADTHPVENATHLTAEVGLMLTLRDWLVANGYIT